MNKVVSVGKEEIASVMTRRVRADACRGYPVHVVNDLLSANLDHLVNDLASRQSLLVSTPTVADLYGRSLEARLQAESIDIELVVLPAREKTKNTENLMAICEEAERRNLGRHAALVGLGGGVCTDLVTVAASMIRRGIPYIRIPTTLLGQVDGSIGVKGAVNFRGRKNWLGCYYPPLSVYVDPGFLATLSTKQIGHGLAEIIKMAIVKDVRLFELVEQYGPQLAESRFQSPRAPAREIMERAIFRMLEELETNMYEDQTYQRLVDFGHTISPTIESMSGFSLAHGEAVAIAMSFCCELARELQVLDEGACHRAVRVIRACGLPTNSPLLTSEAIAKSLHDAARHRAGQLNLVVPKQLGCGTFINSGEQIPGSAMEAARLSLRGTGKVREAPVACLVFDVGGTSMRAAAYDAAKREITDVTTQPTPNHCRYPNLSAREILEIVLDGMNNLSKELLDGRNVDRVSVAFAGPLDGRGQLTAAPTIVGATEFSPIDLRRELCRTWPEADVFLLNDVTAAGYRYLHRHDESLCVVTVGSGIGNKVFIHGRPFTGPNGRGGEIGHVVVDPSPDAIVCDCGGRGHLGGIASGRGTLATAKRAASQDEREFLASRLGRLARSADGILNEHIVSCFREGDPWTVKTIRYVAGKLANVLAHTHQAIGIERFVIFGGFATALGPSYRDLVVQAAEAACWSSGQDWDAMIELGVADDASGLIGAGRYAMEFSEER